MSFPVSENAQFLAEQTNKQINIILEIDGLPTIYGAQDVQKFARIGGAGLLIGNFIIGEPYTVPNSKALVSIKDGTTKNITQQIRIDKSAASSVSTMKIALVDKDDFVSTEMASGNIVPDILSREANVYLGFAGGAHPEDSTRIFSGNITDFNTKTGLVLINISHPDNLKRQSVLPQVTTELTAAISASQTNIPVIDTTDYIGAQESLTSYIQIEDEIMRVTSFTQTQFNVVRGSLGTFLAAHDDESEVSSFYQLQGEPLILALKLLLSGDQLSTASAPVESVSGTTVVFTDFNIQENHGLVVGDLMTIPGIIVDEPIISFSLGDGESSIIVANDLGTPSITTEEATFKSKYDVLPFGAGLSGRQVDVSQFENINGLFGGSFPVVDIYIRDTLNIKEVVDNDILFPIGAISVPRKGRISLTYTSPPLAEVGTKKITKEDVINPNSIEVKRNTNNKFYNSVEYKYDDCVSEEKLQRVNRLISATSLNRIAVGQKQLKIDAKGFRKDATNFIDIQSRRFIDRYKFGAESFKLEITYALGFNMEVGDTVIFEGEGLNLFDSKTGSREVFEPRLMEITNKSLDSTKGKVVVELTDTAYELDGRYGTVGPSSKITSGTVDAVELEPILSVVTEDQNNKWFQYIGEPVKIHSPDYIFEETVTLIGFDNVNRQKALLSPSLSQAPGADWIMTMPDYQDSSALFKLLHPCYTPTISVVSGASSTTFDVSGADVLKFFVGSLITVHDAAFSISSIEVTVTDITGTTITTDKSLGFTPTASHFVDLVGFSDDDGLPYRLI